MGFRSDHRTHVTETGVKHQQRAGRARRRNGVAGRSRSSDTATYVMRRFGTLIRAPRYRRVRARGRWRAMVGARS